MKGITKQPFLEGAPVIVEDLKFNHTQQADLLNQVSHRQLPQECITEAKIPLFEEIDFDAEEANQTTCRGLFNTIASSEKYPNVFPANPTQFLFPEDNANPGWNSLQNLNLDVVVEGANLVIPGINGIAFGYACIDSELRASVANNGPSGELYPNADLWWQFGVFANDQLITTSPKLLPGRHSISMDFVTFIGAEITTFDVRVRIYFGQQQFSGSTTRNAEPFMIRACNIFVRSTGV